MLLGLAPELVLIFGIVAIVIVVVVAVVVDVVASIVAVVTLVFLVSSERVKRAFCQLRNTMSSIGYQRLIQQGLLK